MNDGLSVFPFIAYGGDCLSTIDVQQMAGDAPTFSNSTMGFQDLLKSDVSMTEASCWDAQQDEDEMDLS